ADRFDARLAPPGLFGRPVSGNVTARCRRPSVPTSRPGPSALPSALRVVAGPGALGRPGRVRLCSIFCPEELPDVLERTEPAVFCATPTCGPGLSPGGRAARGPGDAHHPAGGLHGHPGGLGAERP